MSSERPARYRVDARHLPFTPSWFWEIVDVAENTFIENSLAHSRTVYPSPADALAAADEYLIRAAMARDTAVIDRLAA